MILPAERKTVDGVEQEIRRIVDGLSATYAKTIKVLAYLLSNVANI